MGRPKKIKAIVDAETYNQESNLPPKENNLPDNSVNQEPVHQISELKGLGKKIRKPRTKKALTVDDLVKECELKKQKYLVRIEKLKDKISSLNKIYGVKVKDFVDGLFK